MQQQQNIIHFHNTQVFENYHNRTDFMPFLKIFNIYQQNGHFLRVIFWPFLLIGLWALNFMITSSTWAISLSYDRFFLWVVCVHLLAISVNFSLYSLKSFENVTLNRLHYSQAWLLLQMALVKCVKWHNRTNTIENPPCTSPGRCHQIVSNNNKTRIVSQMMLYIHNKTRFWNR